MKASSYINDVIIENNLQSIIYYGILRIYNWSMSCEVAAHANYGTCSINLDKYHNILIVNRK